MMKKSIFLVLFCCIAACYSSFSQITIPDMSSRSTIVQRIGIDDVTIKYSRPSVRNRKIFGDLVPYNQLWRTGANEATTISFPVNIEINNNPIPSGTYSIFTIPNENEWTIILNKNTSLWGVFKYSDKEDVLRFKVKPVTIKDKVETFEIRFQDLKNNSAQMQLVWDNTMIVFNISEAVDSRVMESIKKTIIDSTPNESQPYYRGSIYYLNNNKNLEQAYAWINKAISIDSSYIYFQAKAKLESKLLLKKEAKTSALTGIERVKKENPDNTDFIKQMQEFIKNL